MSMQTIVPSKEKRAARQANLARQMQEGRTRPADGGVHKVDRSTKVSRRTEAATANQVEQPPKRRWKRASQLPQLPDIPGFGLKYVRIDGRHKGDQRGVIRHLQEGWEFARKEDFPEHVLPTCSLDRRGEVIGNGDMVVMKMHDDMIAQRNATYALKRERANKGIETELENKSDPRMPITQKRRTQVEHRRMRSQPRGVSVADDDV